MSPFKWMGYFGFRRLSPQRLSYRYSLMTALASLIRRVSPAGRLAACLETNPDTSHHLDSSASSWARWTLGNRGPNHLLVRQW